MIEKILLNQDEDIKAFEEEESVKFLLALMQEMGVNDPIITTIAGQISPAEKANLRNLLQKYKIQVIEVFEEMQVFVEQQKVGVWTKPKYKLCRDPLAAERRKQLYLEAEINYWTIFESQ